MEAKEFIAKRRRTVQLPDGSEFVIRKVGVMDMLIAGGNPDLGVLTNGKLSKERLKTFADKATKSMERILKDTREQRKFCEAILRRALVAPKIGGEDGIDLADFTFEECDMLAGAVLKFSGFTKEAAESTAPLSGTELSSEISTPAPSDTDGTPPTSSAQGALRPTPSISPVLVQASSTTGKKPSE